MIVDCRRIVLLLKETTVSRAVALKVKQLEIDKQ
jgi:hypothetical protein